MMQATKRERNDERVARTAAAADSVCEYVLANPVWRGEIRAALHAMPQGIPGVYPAAVVKDVVRGLGLLGLPAMDWQRFAKRILSQLGERGDGYRVRCHVVALEEPLAGCYRSQGDHGQAWDGDWQREPVVPEEAKWWLSPSPVLTLEGYSYGHEADDCVAHGGHEVDGWVDFTTSREWATVTVGRQTRTVPVVRD